LEIPFAAFAFFAAFASKKYNDAPVGRHFVEKTTVRAVKKRKGPGRFAAPGPDRFQF
jgi:hypothetical protein